jgi:phage tail sheath gpL-like
MPISFNNIPSNWRVPLYWAEVDPSKAGFPHSNLRALIVGTMISTGATPGAATPDVPIICSRQMDADRLFGQGSELANAFKSFFLNNFAHEVWAGPVAEPSGNHATATITVTAGATQAGVYHLYVAGAHVPVTVAAGDSTNTIASAIGAAIDTLPDLPCIKLSVVGAVVTLQCKWIGASGNGLTLVSNYYGKVGGEETPIGMAVTYSGFFFTGGTNVPSFNNLIANMGETEFEYVSMPYTDSTSLLAWETEYGFTDTGRWGWMREHFGLIFSAKTDTYSNLLTFAATRNGPVTSIMAVEPTSPTPVYEWAAAYCAMAARALTIDPARPLQSLHLTGIKSAPYHDLYILSETNTLANNGLATQRKWDNTTPQIARETTTYQLNLYGQGDDAYELVTTLATLAKLIRNQRFAITSKYPRHKLADDGTRFGVGQAILTPKLAKAELVQQYALDEFNGLVENSTAFKANLVVERDPNDPNRLNVLYPPDLVNQLRVFAVLVQFRLQYNRGVDLGVA